MATIRVPGPPVEAFRKHRPISDLVKSQIKHFQHLEHKLRLDLPTKFSPHDLTTEGAAARYIAEVTTALCAPSPAAQQTPNVIHAIPSAKPAHPSAHKPVKKSAPKKNRQPQEISIAAAAAPKKRHTKKRTPTKQQRKKP